MRTKATVIFRTFLGLIEIVGYGTNGSPSLTRRVTVGGRDKKQIAEG
jgi:hypothetical protein